MSHIDYARNQQRGPLNQTPCTKHWGHRSDHKRSQGFLPIGHLELLVNHLLVRLRREVDSACQEDPLPERLPLYPPIEATKNARPTVEKGPFDPFETEWGFAAIHHEPC